MATSFKVLIDLILLCPCNMQYTNRTVCSLWSKYSPYGELNPFETRKHKGYLAIVAWGYLSNRTIFLETETMITAQMTRPIHNWILLKRNVCFSLLCSWDLQIVCSADDCLREWHLRHQGNKNSEKQSTQNFKPTALMINSYCCWDFRVTR